MKNRSWRPGGRRAQDDGMRRVLIGTAIVGGGAVAVRTLAPKLRARRERDRGDVFARMPDWSPLKRMMRAIEETRDNTARILAILERQAADEHD
jgi:hypothetical protein